MLRTVLLLSLTATLFVVAVVHSQYQPSTSQSPGINQTVFQTPAGKVTVYLPSDMSAGDTISGTVVAEPAAPKDPKKQKENSDELNGYVIELDKNHSRVSDKALRWNLPATISNVGIPLILKDAKGKSVGQILVPIATSSALVPNFNIPNVGQTGHPIRISGPFDGNSTNTKVTIGDSDAPVIAESPRQIIVQNPTVTPGATSININENGATANGAFRNVRVDLTAPKTSLMRGEQTDLKGTVTGLEGLAQPVPVRLRNQTPEVVNLSGGNNQTVPLGPGTAPTQTFTRTLTGVSPGQFNIVADLVVPATSTGATPSTTPPSPPPPPAPPSLPDAAGGPPARNPQPTTGSGMPAASPSPIKGTAPPNNPVVPSTATAMPVATPKPKENPCCKKIRDKNEAEFGRRLLWREGNNDLEILGPFLFIRINGVEAKWKFDRNLEEVFCYLNKYEIDSEVKQVSETQMKGGKTNEKQEVISLLFTGPDPGNQSMRPNKFFQFMASKLDDKKVKEYAASVTVDEEACAFTLSLFGDNQLKEIAGPPARQPMQIFDDLKADHDLEVAGHRPYSSPAWWDVKFRELTEIVQWCGWLRSHPDAEKEEEVRRKAFGGWRLNMRKALEDLKANGKSLSAEDRNAMAAMSKLLDEDVFDCHTAEPTLRAFLAVWSRFNSGGASF